MNVVIYQVVRLTGQDPAGGACERLVLATFSQQRALEMAASEHGYKMLAIEVEDAPADLARIS